MHGTAVVGGQQIHPADDIEKRIDRCFLGEIEHTGTDPACDIRRNIDFRRTAQENDRGIE
jgi:hypothetical protein